MNIDRDKILFDALRNVLQDKTQGSVGQAFHVCQEDLQELYSSLSLVQQDIISAYLQALQDVYMAAYNITLDK